MKGSFWPAAAACLMSGCASSPPMHFFTLTELAPAARLTAAAGAPPVRLDRVTIPSELDRTQLVRRIDATRVQLMENDRWAAPLDDMIRRVLSDDLSARLPVNLVADPNEPAAGERPRSLAVDIRELYGDATCAVELRASWVVSGPDSKSVRGTQDIRIPPGSACAVSALPGAMSQALAQLSDRIAAAITAGSPAPGG